MATNFSPREFCRRFASQRIDPVERSRLTRAVRATRVYIPVSLFSGHDLSPRVRNKVSRLAEHLELSGRFSVGRKAGGFWIARVQKGRGMRALRRYEEISRCRKENSMKAQ